MKTYLIKRMVEVHYLVNALDESQAEQKVTSRKALIIKTNHLARQDYIQDVSEVLEDVVADIDTLFRNGLTLKASTRRTISELNNL